LHVTESPIRLATLGQKTHAHDFGI
jgi:hypothetical protein